MFSPVAFFMKLLSRLLVLTHKHGGVQKINQQNNNVSYLFSRVESTNLG